MYQKSIENPPIQYNTNIHCAMCMQCARAATDRPFRCLDTYIILKMFCWDERVSDLGQFWGFFKVIKVARSNGKCAINQKPQKCHQRSILINPVCVCRIRIWWGSLANRFNHYREGHRTQNKRIGEQICQYFKPFQYHSFHNWLNLNLFSFARSFKRTAVTFWPLGGYSLTQ